MQAQLDADKAAMAAKKLEQRARMQETIKENEAKIEAQKLALIKAKAEDARIAEEYTRMLDEQDKRRQAALADLFSKTHLRAQVAGESAVRAAAEKEREELQRIAELQAQRNAAEEAAAKAKTAAAKASALDMVATLSRQIAEQEAEKKRRAAELEEHMRRVIAHDEASLAEDAAKAAERKQRDIELQEALEAQMAAQKEVQSKAHLMTDAERELNKKRVEEAKALLAKK